jgi:hypothetical protein
MASPIGDLPSTGQSFRHQERDLPQGSEPSFGEFVKAGAQQRNPVAKSPCSMPSTP